MAMSKLSLKEFTDSLSIVCLEEISKYLDPFEIVSLSFESSRWFIGAMRNDERRKRSSKSFIGNERIALEVRFGEKSSTFICKFGNDRSQSFLITLEESKELGSEMQVEKGLAEKQTLNVYGGFYRYRPHVLTCRSGDLSKIERRAVRIIQIVARTTEVRYHSVVVDLGARDPEVPLSLLAELPYGYGGSFHLLQCKKPVNGKHLEKLLANVQFSGSINVLTSMDQFITGMINLNVTSTIDITDARWLTRKHLEWMQFQHAIIGTNTLTSEDINVFLKIWRSAARNENLKEISFELSENQEIDMEEALKDIYTRPWDRTVRDRFHMEDLNEPLDMKDGIDIRNIHGDLGTLLLTKDRLIFLIWINRFPMRDQRSIYRTALAEAKNELQLEMMYRKKYQQMVKWRDTEEHRKLLRDCEAEIRRLEVDIRHREQILMYIYVINH